MADKNSTIIIKKIKKGGHGHHGGAWKVAYADFVTAMMAFFLLMWLLNATEAEELAGLADYFAPTLGVRDKMGIGFRGGKSALAKGIGADKNTNKGIIFGGTNTGPIVKVTEKFELVTNESETEKLVVMIGEQSKKSESEKATSKVEEAIKEFVNDEVTDSGKNVNIIQSLRGLEVQIRSNDSMFESETAILKDDVKSMLAKLAEIIQRLPNYLSISGHTTSTPLGKKNNYTNWELSTDRANAARRFLILSGIPPEQIAEVVGKSDNEPLDPKHPDAPVNSRIGLILLRQNISPNHKKGAPESVFLDPASENAKKLVSDSEDTDETKKKQKKEQPINEEIKDVIKEDLEESVTEEDIILDVEDPFGGEESSAPSDLNIEQQIEKKDTIDQKMKDLILKNEKIPKNEIQAQDPFTGEGGSAPSELFVKEGQAPKKKAQPKLPNAYLFEEDEDDGEDFEEIDVQDPFSGLNSISVP